MLRQHEPESDQISIPTRPLRPSGELGTLDEAAKSKNLVKSNSKDAMKLEPTETAAA